MLLTGTLIQKNAPVSGQSSKGMWTKQEFVIETSETYPKKVCISVWNDTLKDVVNAKLGDTLTAHVQVESREYNGRWYTEVKAIAKVAKSMLQNGRCFEGKITIVSNGWAQVEVFIS